MTFKRNVDRLPIIPKDATVHNVTCNFCIVGCGYKAYSWDVSRQGGSGAGDNWAGVDLGQQQPSETDAWYPPSMYNIVRQNGRPVHLVIKPDKDCVVNSGLGSIRGARMAELNYSKITSTQLQRLTDPMAWRYGQMQPTSWDDALTLVAEITARVIKEQGEDGLFVSAFDHGGAGGGYENTWGTGKLYFGAMKVKNIRIHNRPAYNSEVHATRDMGVGELNNCYEDAELCDTIVAVGTNALETQTNYFLNHWVPNLRGASLAKKQAELPDEPHAAARIVIVDPRRTVTVNACEVEAGKDNVLHLAINSGTDLALFNAWLTYIAEQGWVDQEFLAASTTGFDEAVAANKTTLEEAAAVTGLTVDQIKQAAHWIAEPKDGKRRRTMFSYEKGLIWGNDNYRTNGALVNVALATGNIGRPGVGVNPLRGQNNVQGSCDMGSFPHELPGYRSVADAAVREAFEARWGVTLDPEPGYRIPNMFNAAIAGNYKGMYVQGEDLAQSDPNTQHVHAALRSLECLVVQDIFFNETAKFAHVFLPGASFLEKDGTFTNAERRISRVRKVMEPLSGKADWQATQALAQALGVAMDYRHPSEIMDEIAALTPSFAGVSYDRLEATGSLQWPCNDASPAGTPIMHTEHFTRGLGRFVVTEYVPTTEKVTRRFPLILTTGRILSQYNVGAQTRRTANTVWHSEDRLDIHPLDAADRGIADGDWVHIESRAGETRLRARVTERMQPGVVYTTFHFPDSGANVVTTDNSDWATNCPEYKVTAVQVSLGEQPARWQADFTRHDADQHALLPPGPDA